MSDEAAKDEIFGEKTSHTLEVRNLRKIYGKKCAVADIGFSMWVPAGAGKGRRYSAVGSVFSLMRQ